MRFLLVDQILELEPGESASGIKNVTMSEDFLDYHFPGTPIMPGCLIAASAIQLADWLVRASTGFRRAGLLSSFESARFHHLVRPGDQLDLRVEATELGEERARFRARVGCRGRRVASGRFVLDLVDASTLEDEDDARRFFDVLTVRMREEART